MIGKLKKPDIIEMEKILKRFGNDTVVECNKCGQREYLDFANGLKNGWSKCCGYTMTLIFTKANIGEAVRSTVNSQVPSGLKI